MNNTSVHAPGVGSPRSNIRMLQYAVIGALFGVLFPILGSIIKIFQLGLPLSFSNAFSLQGSEPLLWITDTAPIFLGLAAAMLGRREDLLLEANAVLTARQAELDAARLTLENAAAGRAQELDQRNAQMRAVIEFARLAAETRDLSSLLNAAVETISRRFGHHEADVYLLEDNGQSAALRASSSLSGKNLLNEGFRIGFNDPGIVGRVLRRAKSIVFSGQPGRQVTLPLTVRGQVIGALDVRSDQPESAGHSEVETFQLIADQLAASIENARLVAQSRSTVSQLEALSARGTRNAWQEYLKNRDWAFRFTPSGMSSVSPAQEAATPEGLRVPVLLRGQKIGSIALSRRTAGAWEPADRELAERVAAQLALALENARLLEQTRERAAQEQIISEISARLNRSLDVDAVLQAAVREFAGLPDVAEAEITLTPSGAGNHHAGS